MGSKRQIFPRPCLELALNLDYPKRTRGTPSAQKLRKSWSKAYAKTPWVQELRPLPYYRRKDYIHEVWNELAASLPVLAALEELLPPWTPMPGWTRVALRHIPDRSCC